MKKIYIVLTLSLMGSCAKFLEPSSPSDFIPKNITSLNEVLTSNGYLLGPNLFSYLEAFSDDVQITTENATIPRSDLRERTKRIMKITWDVFDANTSDNASPWESLFSGILYCNGALDYLPAVDGSDEEKNYVKAQALFLRALHYFYLVNYYGEPYNFNKKSPAVPIKLTSELVEKMTPRNSVEEVYEVILSDLHEAESCWERIPQRHFKKDYRANYPATQFLLSKVYLFMENWSEAKKYAEKVLEWESFSLCNINNFEGSLTKPALDYGNYSYPETIWTYGSIKQYTVAMREKANLPKTSSKDDTYTRNSFIASNDLLSSYEENDLRKDLYIFKEWGADTQTPAGRYLETYLPFGKIENNANMFPTESLGSSSALKFRLSEAYLMLAESCAMLGDENEAIAINALNTLRENRYNRQKLG